MVIKPSWYSRRNHYGIRALSEQKLRGMETAYMPSEAFILPPGQYPSWDKAIWPTHCSLPIRSIQTFSECQFCARCCAKC